MNDFKPRVSIYVKTGNTEIKLDNVYDPSSDGDTTIKVLKSVTEEVMALREVEHNIIKTQILENF